MIKQYGNAPIDLGLIDLSPKEMMFWLYCPIKLPHQEAETYPDNLRQFMPIVNEVYKDCAFNRLNRWTDSYVYISAKRMHISPTSIGNRPGWHCDGFMTDDLNYVWYDYNPTQFYISDVPVSLTQDHETSIEQMEAYAAGDPYGITTYPLKHLLRLDETVIHRVGPEPAANVRTFVKISVSYEKYALEGNSVNHKLAPDWEYQSRKEERNCPIGR